MRKSFKGPTEYPLIDYFLTEIRKTAAVSPLASVLLACTLAELVMREVKDFGGRDYAKYLERLLSEGLISEKQYDAADQIRYIRNLYSHVDFMKFVEAGNQYIETDPPGLIAFANDEFLSSMNKDDVPAYFDKMVKYHNEDVKDLLRTLLGTTPETRGGQGSSR